jgi:hypothetical protein
MTFPELIWFLAVPGIPGADRKMELVRAAQFLVSLLTKEVP